MIYCKVSRISFHWRWTSAVTRNIQARQLPASIIGSFSVWLESHPSWPSLLNGICPLIAVNPVAILRHKFTVCKISAYASALIVSATPSSLFSSLKTWKPHSCRSSWTRPGPLISGRQGDSGQKYPPEPCRSVASHGDSFRGYVAIGSCQSSVWYYWKYWKIKRKGHFECTLCLDRTFKTTFMKHQYVIASHSLTLPWRIGYHFSVWKFCMLMNRLNFNT